LRIGIDLAALFEASFGEVSVFEIFQVFFDEFAGVEGLGSPSFFGEAGQAFLNRGLQSNGQHVAPSNVTHA
jgi:hypothetical protein